MLLILCCPFSTHPEAYARLKAQACCFALILADVALEISCLLLALAAVCAALLMSHWSAGSDGLPKICILLGSRYASVAHRYAQCVRNRHIHHASLWSHHHHRLCKMVHRTTVWSWETEAILYPCDTFELCPSLSYTPDISWVQRIGEALDVLIVFAICVTLMVSRPLGCFLVVQNFLNSQRSSIVQPPTYIGHLVQQSTWSSFSHQKTRFSKILGIAYPETTTKQWGHASSDCFWCRWYYMRRKYGMLLLLQRLAAITVVTYCQLERI